MEVRPAAIEDYEELNDLFIDADRLHYTWAPTLFNGQDSWGRSKVFIECAIQDPTQTILVAAHEAQVIGFIHLTLVVKAELGVLRERRSLVVDALVVRESDRGSGVGKALMLAAEQWGIENGMTSVELTVWCRNDAALRFYEGMGYGAANLRMRKELA